MSNPPHHDTDLQEVAQPGADSFDPVIAAQAIVTCLDKGDSVSVSAWLKDLQSADAGQVIAFLDSIKVPLLLPQCSVFCRALKFVYPSFAFGSCQIGLLPFVDLARRRLCLSQLKLKSA